MPGFFVDKSEGSRPNIFRGVDIRTGAGLRALDVFHPLREDYR